MSNISDVLLDDDLLDIANRDEEDKYFGADDALSL